MPRSKRSKKSKRSKRSKRREREDDSADIMIEYSDGGIDDYDKHYNNDRAKQYDAVDYYADLEFSHSDDGRNYLDDERPDVRLYFNDGKRHKSHNDEPEVGLYVNDGKRHKDKRKKHRDTDDDESGDADDYDPRDDPFAFYVFAILSFFCFCSSFFACWVYGGFNTCKKFGPKRKQAFAIMVCSTVGGIIFLIIIIAIIAGS